FERAEEEAEERADAREEQRGADRLRDRRVEAAAPEIGPSDDDEDGGHEIRRVAEQLERRLGEKRADAAREVGGRAVRAGAEEPHRIGRLVAGERDDPDQRRGEERDAEELADAARNG